MKRPRTHQSAWSAQVYGPVRPANDNPGVGFRALVKGVCACLFLLVVAMLAVVALS